MIKIQDLIVCDEIDVSAVHGGWSFGASNPANVGGYSFSASSPAVDDYNAPVKESVSFSYTALLYDYS